jgi:hypothetical protein
MRDLSFLNRYDRDEPVVIGRAGRKNLAVYFVFEDYDATILRAMHNKCVAGVKLDRSFVGSKLLK